MARLESQVKMGYYPTPRGILERIFEKVEINSTPKKPVRVLDPCCGQGEVLEFIKNKYENIVLYGIELDKKRYEITQEKLKSDQIYNTDALEATLSGKCDILYLNPPYDYYRTDEGTAQSVRLETLFTEKYLPYLADGGLVVFVLPLNSVTVRELTDAMARIEQRFAIKNEGRLFYLYGDVFKPESEFSKFKQFWVVFQKRKPDENSATLSANRFFNDLYVDAFYIGGPNREYSYEDATRFFEQRNEEHATEENVVVMPKSSHLKIYPLNIGGEKVLEIVRSTGLVQREIKEAYADKWMKQSKIQPLTELRKGHLAQLLAAGYMNGEMTVDGRRAIIKGTLIRDKQETINDEDEKASSYKVSETYYHRIHINLLYLDKNPELVKVE